jgi:alanine dehydrogenase
MNIGVPLEVHGQEHRVGLNPFGVSRLVRKGFDVFVQHGGGADCHFTDEDYTKVGAQIVFSAEEAYQRGDIVCRISSLDDDEIDLIRPGSTICGFHHLAVKPKQIVEQLAAKEVNLIGWEITENELGRRPVLTAFSEIAGHMAIHTAAHLLEHDQGGRGVLLGRMPGITPATVVILGAGILGRTAAKLLGGLGAQVIVLDQDLARLRELTEFVPGNVVTAMTSHRNLARYTAIADVVIGAVLVPGGRAPFLVTEEMVKEMKEGSVILDLSIDQGGCVETSRPTHPVSPTFKLHGVTHYCVPNMTANVPRDASRALTLSSLPYLMALAEKGTEQALRDDPGLARGAYLFGGRVVNEQAAAALDLPYQDLADVLS